MPEGPRTIHIFMNFLQCYSLWRTVFEPNHCEYRVDLLNWHEHSCPTFKMPAPRLFCICFEHNDRVRTFLGRRTICLSSRMTCLSSRISGTVVREICPRWEFFPLVGYRQAYGPAVLRGFWHPDSGNGRADMADQTSATIVRLVQTGEVHQLSIFDHYVGEIDAPYYS